MISEEKEKEKTNHHEWRMTWSSLRAREIVKEKSKTWATRAWRAFATLLQLITLLRTSIFFFPQKKKMGKREALTDTQKQKPKQLTSLSHSLLSQNWNWWQNIAEDTTKIPRRLQREWLGNSLSFLRYINLCLFLKHFLLSPRLFYAKETFLSTIHLLRYLWYLYIFMLSATVNGRKYPFLYQMESTSEFEKKSRRLNQESYTKMNSTK